MKKNKIIMSILCGLMIYLFTILNQIYAPVLCEKIFGRDIVHHLAPVILIFQFLIPLSIIIFPVIFFEKKFDLSYNNIPVISGSMYVTFAIYTPPSWYLFVCTSHFHIGGYLSDSGSTGGWGYDTLSSPVAAFWVTLEYTIIVAITLRCLKKKNKHN